ncbi:rCG35145 [Rattus norvegicus]|uniref:RCG35145 n=1 Tax=Rattus norvegicus TaxID=10116 RepID=A6HL80_RAT|nr:rCG35145 [Rattus norvegicus]
MWVSGRSKSDAKVSLKRTLIVFQPLRPCDSRSLYIPAPGDPVLPASVGATLVVCTHTQIHKYSNKSLKATVKDSCR